MTFLNDKIALVTGGNRGIGRGVVEALHREGARVFLTAREAGSATSAAQAVGARATGLACDVRDDRQVRQVFERIGHDAGGLDILVNNAGIGIFGPIADMRPEDWRATIETNLNGVFYCT